MRDDLKRQIFFKKRQTKKLSIKIIERQTAAAAEELSTTWEIKHRKSRIGIKTYVPKLWSSSSSSSLKIFITHKMIFWFANIHTLESKIKKERRRRRSNYEFTNTHTHTHTWVSFSENEENENKMLWDEKNFPRCDDDNHLEE